MSPTTRHILAAPAWPYANGPRHIGHVSGFGLPCDMFSRYQRMAGNKVLMVSGTDEHGTPIQVQADKENTSPRELVDRYNRVIGEDLYGLDMSYNLFTRTVTRNHYAVTQEIFLGLYQNGYIFPKTTLGAISPSTGRTLPDRYIEGTCPICGYDGARGDQRPRAITRDLDWGVPVPLDGWRDRPDKRIYVWFDAVIGYLSASIEWAQRSGDPEAWRAWWQQPDAEAHYFMGKDNIVFHSEIWPAILLGYAGRGDRGGEPGRLGALNLPYEVVSSEFLIMEAQKFSASRGVGILVRDFLARYDADALRYYLSVAGPESQDTDFTWAEFLRRNNDELVAGWGNLVNRSLSLTAKNFGRIPEPGELSDVDIELLARSRASFGTVGGLLAQSRFK